MSLSKEQQEANSYALKNCVFEGGSLMGGDLGDTYSCEMGINGDIGTDAVHEDGYHKIEVDITNVDGSAGIEEVFVKPILSTDVTKDNFGSVIRIETLSGEVIDLDSELGKNLVKNDNFSELYTRSLAQLKFVSETSGVQNFVLSKDQWEAANEAIARNDDGDLKDLWDKINTDEHVRNSSFPWLFKYKDLNTNEYSEDQIGVRISTPEGETTVINEREEEEQTVEDLDTNNGLGEIFKLFPVLKYPADAAYGAGGQDYIRFETFKYKPPNVGAFNKERRRDDNPAVIDVIKGSGPKRSTNLGDYGNTIKLPIPNDLRVSNGVEWGGGKANAMEMAAFQGATNKIGEVEDGGFGNIFKGMDNIGKFIDNVTKLDNDDRGGGTAMTAFLAKMMLSSININVDTNQFVARSLGIAINPNLELLFSSPKLRNFTFRFDFAPNDEQDAKMSRHIMRVFRQGMQPTGYAGRQSGQRIGTANIFIGAPRVFRIGYFNGTNRIRGLPIHKICALTQVSTNFTPENVYQSYADSNAVSNPVRSTMELAFTELTPIFAEDYLDPDGDGGTKEQKANASIADLRRAEGEGGILQGDNKINVEDIGF
tara:strand:- start:687 stop:2474 length:1788 start_codon:yes stop_codon:yes gene_type:complete